MTVGTESKKNNKGVSSNDKLTYACDICPFKGKNNNNLSNHRRRIHKAMHKCKICEYETTRLTYLENHKRKHVNRQIQQFECGIGECHKKYRQDTSLSRHKTRQHGYGGNHTCNICDKVFTIKDALRVHLGVIHQEGSYKITNYHCSLCSYVNYRLYNLKRHIESMHKK